MKKVFLPFVLFGLYSNIFAQIAPQKNFSEKISLSEQKNAAAFLKGTLEYNGDNYDLKYHRFSWNIDPDTLFISGEVTSYFVITKASVNQISFDLSSVLIVDSIKYHSSILTFSHAANNALTIDLPSALSINTLDSLSVFYHGNPPNGEGFGSFIKSDHEGTPIIWTLSEPFGAKDWWPCKNDLSDKIDSIDIFVTTPQQYKAASNGMLISEITQSGFKTAHWKHRYPIAAYLIGVAVTDYQTFSNYAHYADDSIQILNYVFPESLSNAQQHMPDVVQSLELFDSLFTLYPFVNERYGQTQFKWGGGMEHQTMTFLGDFSFDLMTHELAHQWVGDMITCGNWHDIWLNESFATYWTGLAYEHLFNGYYWNIWKKYELDDIISEPGGSVYCYDTTSVERIFDSRLTYNKGAMVLHSLRWIVGDSAFFAGMKNYLTDLNLTYSYACSDDFISHIENASGKNLTEFFHDWLYGEGYPSYTIHAAVISDNNVQLTITQTQSHNSVSFFEMPLPIKFKNETRDTIIILDNTFSGQQYTVNPGFHADSIIFDPEMWIISGNDTVISNIEVHSSLADFSVFPNPFTDFLTINFAGNKLQQAEVYDVRGMLVTAVKADNSIYGSLKFSMPDIAKGVYFLKLIFDDKIVVNKIAKFE
ncbi:MAG: T9SS type A sorting domain-containing protein [Bacteroidetes bacterium]|nr:T9SS type A sorting domain-containing protein [Bacteroidota bacterium]